MANFEPAPEQTLTTADETLGWVKAHEDRSRWQRACPRVKSLYLIDIIKEIMAEKGGRGFAYNADVKRRAADRLGIDVPQNKEHEEGDALSWLVYMAQQYRRSDALRAEGFAPFTQAMVDAAFERKAKIELQGEGLIGNTVRQILNVRRIEGTAQGTLTVAMQPRARARYYRADGYKPARIVDAKGNVLPFTEPPPRPPTEREAAQEAERERQGAENRQRLRNDLAALTPGQVRT